MSKHDFSPESLMMSYGYKPSLSEGAIKCPIFQTSTFVFETAEKGKAFFEVAYGLREKKPREKLGLIYSRLNNPDLEILENRLTLWDKAEAAAVFESGMSAISTTMLEFLSPGQLILHSEPLYGGTDHFIRKVLPRFGIKTMGFTYHDSKTDLLHKIEQSGLGSSLGLIFLETPANPTNDLIDIQMITELANELGNGREEKILVVVDNTYLGPVFQHPIELGADLVIYSATKYIGGHSDVIAGACLGKNEHIGRLKNLRTFLGCMAGPWTGWLLMRSLETLKVRMEKQAKNAESVAEFLNTHPKIEKVYYLGNLKPEDGKLYDLYKRQCKGHGAMLSFDVKGGEKQAFAFMNNLKMIKLAVSLGGTECLAEHPATMTHSDVEPELREKIGITDKMVRISVGIEDPKDIIWDIKQALEQV